MNIRSRTATRRRRAGGFTLIELMVVMLILVMLASVATVSYIRTIDKARPKKAQADIAALEEALDLYYVDLGEYPSSEQGLIALREPPPDLETPEKWQGPYLKRDIPLDPWGREYQFISPGQINEDYDIYSFGRDGQEGGEGPDADITNFTSPSE